MADAPIPPIPAQKADVDSSSQLSNFHLEASDTTIDDRMTFDVELTSYGEMRALAREIKKRLDVTFGGKAAHVFFLDNALRLALDVAPAVDLQIEQLKAAFEAAESSARDGLASLASAPPQPATEIRPPTAAPAVAPAVVPAIVAAAPIVANAAMALLGALRADTRYAGRQVTIAEHAFALALAHQWEDGQVRFHYPTLFVPKTGSTSVALEKFAKDAAAAGAARHRAAHAVSDLLAHVSRLDSANVRFAAAKAALDAARDQLQAAEAVFDDLSAKITKADEGTGLTRLQLLERAAYVKAIAAGAKGSTFYLFAQIVAAGGAFRVEKSAIRRDSIEHTGGCAATYGLFDDAGTLVTADTIGRRSAYQDSRPAAVVG